MNALQPNDRAVRIADGLADDAALLRVQRCEVAGARVLDVGTARPGGHEAGRRFAEACLGGLGTVTLVPVQIGGSTVPGVAVTTDHPVRALLGAQYAGWQLKQDGFFAMASGPGRGLVRAEPLFEELLPDAEPEPVALFALETRDLPPAELVERIAERAGVSPTAVTLLTAPTASLAGSVQIAARVVETALHKLHELSFDVHAVVAGSGSAPLPPVAADDATAIGRTNDAVLYGGSVHLTVDAEDDALAEVAQRLPSSASDAYGAPFGETLKAANWDFYAIDPLLFSPAEVALTSTRSGRTHRAGRIAADVLERSFMG